MDEELGSKIEKVVGNDDLLMAILVRLPPKSIFKFMCVSKRWINIIFDSFFLETYKRKQEQRKCSDGLVAFILITPQVVNYPGSLITILPTATTTTRMMKKVPTSFGDFINYSDGLILFGRQPEFSTSNLYILNPLTRKSIMLPPPTSLDQAIMGLVCNNTRQLTPDYRVVAAALIPYEDRDNTLPIQTYSSKTRKWEKSTLIATGKFSLSSPVVVVNGVFHWYATGLQLAVYDSKINGNHHVRLIELPYDNQKTCDSKSTITRSSSNSINDDDGVLWFARNNRDNIMKFWMLPKYTDRCSTTIPRNEWILKHTITHDSLRLETTKVLSSISEKERKINVGKSFELEALIPWKQSVVAVIRLGERIVFLYDIATKSFELVRYHGTCWDYSVWTPYVQSPSLSSFALGANHYL